MFIVRMLPYLGDNLEDNIASNNRKMNDKLILISAMNLTSQFKNFLEM